MSTNLGSRVVVLAAASLVAVGVSAAGPVLAAEVVALYVSLDGRPEWSGRLPEPNADQTDGPLPSPAAARDAIRVRRAAGDWKGQTIAVHILGGTYFLEEPLTFGPDDGGTKDAPVTYAAHGNETPVISGGRLITGFKPVEIDGRRLWAAEVPGVQRGEWYFHQLFVNGQRRHRPRLPKEGFYRFTGLPTATPETQWNQGMNTASFQPGELKAWQNLTDIEIVAVSLWITSRLPISAVNEDEKIVQFTRPSVFRLTNSHAAGDYSRYWIENVFEALDTPGEWYLNRASGTLYYLPMPGETPENITVIAPRLPYLVNIAGKADGSQPIFDLHLKGLHFAHAGWVLPPDTAGASQAAVNVPGAVTLSRAGRCSIRDGRVSQVSTYAIELTAGCEDNIIAGNELVDLGAGGVKVGHDTNRTTVTDNEIGPGGHIHHAAVGVWIGASGYNTVTHNHIHDLYYTGISVGWNWGYAVSKAVRNRIEYNHIHDIGKGLLSDMGGIYTLGLSPGTVLRYNLIHDIEASNYGGWGLYTDEGSTGILLENNIVYRTSHSGFHQHYGQNNFVRNNVFAFGRQAQMMRTRAEDHISFFFEHNIVYFDDAPLLASNWSGNFRMNFNNYWRVGGQPFDFAGASLEEWRQRGHDTHSVIADPLFTDPANDDFTLQSDSPALKIGFVPIDTSRIGRQK